MSDSEIIELYNSGERQQAFNIIVRTYGEKLYFHIRRMVAIHEDADDCLQNTFIKVWNALETFRGDSNLYTWLYRIATNETITFLRKQRISALFSPVDFAARLSADSTFNGDNVQRALQKAIAKLPPKQKAVFTMRYYDELPYEEMSEILGTSVGALKASYHHAYLKVKEWVLNFYEN